MQSKSFVKILRKVIREEVRSAVKEIFTEQSMTDKQVINNGMNLSEATPRPKQKKMFSKNTMLNDILNETSGLNGQGPVVSQDEFPNLGDFKSSMAESFGTSRQAALATTDVNGNLIDTSNPEIAKTLNVMTKDYSGLMKAIDKKKGK